MSVKDSIAIGLQTLVSNGFGASVGLEAGYTQMGSAIRLRASGAASTAAPEQTFGTMVGCRRRRGAIGAAFNAHR